MCLIAIAWQTHPRFPLALIANRDEFHARPTAGAGFDPDAPDLYGGRDLQAGGGWLMVSRRGRLAAVTNVRDGTAGDAAPRSRGTLVPRFRERIRGIPRLPRRAARRCDRLWMVQPACLGWRVARVCH